MNHVPSDQSFYIESEEEDDRKDYEEEEDDDQSHSYSSDANDDNQTQTKPSSYTTAWPQSYRFYLYPFIFNYLCFDHKVFVFSIWSTYCYFVCSW